MSDINLALLSDFIVEAEEHLDEIEALLLHLSETPDDLETLNDIFRPVHNIKGGSQITGLEKVAHLSHRMEDLLDILRQGYKDCTSEMVDVLIATRDRIVILVAELEQYQEERSEVDDLVDRLTAFIEGDDTGEKPTAEQNVQAGEAGADDLATEQKTGDAPDQETPAEASESTTQDAEYREEHDRELYGIFTGHLKEQILTLRKAVSQQHEEPELDHYLEWCEDIIDSLWSAANYMGYQELAVFYQDWSDAIVVVRSALAKGEAVETDVMADYLDRLESQFSNLVAQDFAEEQPRQAAETPAATAQEVEEKQEAKEGDVSDSVAEMFAGQGFDVDEEGISEEPVNETDSEETVSEETVSKESGVQATPEAAQEEEPAMEINRDLLNDFIVEAGDHLDEIEAILLQLGDDPTNLELLNDVFRPVHNIKGGSQITGLARISRLSHRLEDLLDLLRQDKLPSTMATVDLLIDARDRIVQLVNELSLDGQEQSAIDDLVMKISDRIDGSTGILPAEPEVQEAEPATPQQPVAQATMDGGACIYEEEHDQELFGIFMNHLHEQVSILRKSINEMHREPDKVTHLQWCKDTLSALWSAANYMSFLELTNLYEQWSDELDIALISWETGQAAPLDFMDAYLERLDTLFPQLRDVPTTSIVGETEQPKAAGTPSPVPPVPPQEPAPSVPAGGELDQRLSQALDNVMNQVPSQEQMNTLGQVFEQTLAGTQPEQQAKQQAVSGGTQAAAKAVDKTDDKRRSGETLEKKIKKSMRVDAEKIDSLMNLVGELVVDRSYFYQMANEMRELQSYFKDAVGVDQKELKMMRAFTYRLGEAIASLGRTSNELQEGVMKMRMLPISQIFNRYPRLVRDLTHNTDKKVELDIQGEDTELDKMIVEELSDPLIHIIRNAVDHGLESREERQQAGKSEVGTLALNAYQESNNVVIEVTDNGRGISPERVKKRALERGLFTAEQIELMSPRELNQLILMPGFSTAEKVTGTSGRGVGMDVVKRNIEKLNGILEIESVPGKRTQMRLKIPLTLAIIHALMIRVGEDLFTIPLSNVDETVRIYRDETSKVEGVDVVHLRGQALPVFHLSRLFDIKADEDNDKVFVVIVNTEGSRTGFVVDELIGQEEVVIKPLVDYVQEKSGFSGATIVGDGRISLILDTHELVKMTSGRQAKKHKQQASELRTRIRRRPPKPRANSAQPPGTVH